MANLNKLIYRNQQQAFFMAINPVGQRRLFVTDGTAAGTIVLRNDYIQLFTGFANFAVLNNESYFTNAAGVPNYNYATWKSDGSQPASHLYRSKSIAGKQTCNSVRIHLEASVFVSYSLMTSLPPNLLPI